MKSIRVTVFGWLVGLSTLSIFAQNQEEIAKHATEKAPTFFDFLVNPRFITKFLVMFVIALIVLALLKSNKMNKGIKVIILAVSTLLFGIAGNFVTYFAMHPSPLCSVEKSMLFGFRIPMIITLFVILFLTFLGPRLFCGWVCPVGAIQELIAMLADKKKIRRIKLNFTLSNSVRSGIFLAFLFLSVTSVLTFTFKDKEFPLSIYNYLNAFHGFEFGAQPGFMDYLVNYIPFVLTLVLAFKLYRPFCHLVCPIGLITNYMEQISIFKISLDKKACTDCGVCTQKAPCPAIPEIMKSAEVRPDCFSCMVCTDVCPENALRVGVCKTTNAED